MKLRRHDDPTDTEVQQALAVATTCQTDGCTEPVHGTCCLCDTRTCFEHGTFSRFADEWFCNLSYDVRYGRSRAACERVKS